jgi:hypothetical protein
MPARRIRQQRAGSSQNNIFRDRQRVTLVVTILALQAYFDKIWNEAVYEKVLVRSG